MYEKAEPKEVLLKDMEDFRAYTKGIPETLSGIDLEIYTAHEKYLLQAAKKAERDLEKLEDLRRSLKEAGMRVALARANSSVTANSAYSSKNASSNSRRDVTDDSGRTQGYLQDGRIYNDKSDVVGYVDEYNRVYDKDHRRVGEVEKDGKITKYK